MSFALLSSFPLLSFVLLLSAPVMLSTIGMEASEGDFLASILAISFPQNCYYPIRGRSHKHLGKKSHIFLVYIVNTVEIKGQMNRVKFDFVLPSSALNSTGLQSNCSRCNLFNTCFKKHDGLLVTVCFAKIWRLPRQHFGFFEEWRNFGNPPKFGKIFEMGVALILR